MAGSYRRVQRVYNIQALRAVAALIVTFHHIREMYVSHIDGILDFRIGAAGVDIFFIISGFIMVVTTSHRPITPAKFLERRIKRIVPLYWLVTFMIIAMLFIGLQPIGLASSDLGIGSALGSLFFVPFYRQGGELLPFLGVGWSLNFEMFFYLLFGIGLFFAGQKRRLIFITGCLIGLVALGGLVKMDAPAWFAFTHPILLEFAAGLWLGYAYLKWPPSAISQPRALGPLLLILGVIALLATVVLYKAPKEQLFMLRPLVWGIPALFIVVGTLLSERAGLISKNKFMQLMGDASYALYLIHPIVLQTTHKAFTAVFPKSLATTIMMSIAALILSIVAGLVLHLFIEKPITRFLNKSSKPKELKV